MSIPPRSIPAGTPPSSSGGPSTRFPPPLLEPAAPVEGLPAAGDLDITAMKIAAIGGRGARKDFVDLDPMPRLLGTWTWDAIRGFFEGEVRRLAGGGG